MEKLQIIMAIIFRQMTFVIRSSNQLWLGWQNERRRWTAARSSAAAASAAAKLAKASVRSGPSASDAPAMLAAVDREHRQLAVKIFRIQSPNLPQGAGGGGAGSSWERAWPVRAGPSWAWLGLAGQDRVGVGWAVRPEPDIPSRPRNSVHNCLDIPSEVAIKSHVNRIREHHKRLTTSCRLVDKRLICGPTAPLDSCLLTSGPSPHCLCKTSSCSACPRSCNARYKACIWGATSHSNGLW